MANTRHPIILFAALAAPGLAQSAPAACPAGQQTLFACTTTNGKQVQVCDAGRTINYRFGRQGQPPEMALAVPRQQASTWQWPGIGRTTTYSVTVPNGDTRYTVYSSFDRLADELDFQYGINVEVRGRQVANLRCREDGLVDNLEGVDLPASN